MMAVMKHANTVAITMLRRVYTYTTDWTGSLLMDESMTDKVSLTVTLTPEGAHEAQVLSTYLVPAAPAVRPEQRHHQRLSVPFSSSYWEGIEQ